VARLGVVVLAHRSPRQVGRLVRALADDAVRCYVHIDRASPTAVHQEVAALLGAEATLLPSRRTPWGGYALVEATLDGIRAARADGARTVAVLSGQDYPVVPTRDLVGFLAENADRTFMDAHVMPRADWPRASGGLELYDARGARVLGRQVLVRDTQWTKWLPRRRIDVAPLQPHHGSAISILSAAACDHLLHHLADDRDRRRLFRLVAVPDETAFHTVLLSSALAGQVVRDNLLFADWSRGGDHPEVIRDEHLADLRTGRWLFARKFDLEARPDLLDRVDVELRRTEPVRV
jgi:hypothetical protein